MVMRARSNDIRSSSSARFHLFPLLCAASFPATFVASAGSGGAWPALTLAYAFALLPLLDALVGERPESAHTVGGSASAGRDLLRQSVWPGALALGALAFPAIWLFGVATLAGDRSVSERTLGAVSLGVLGGGMGMTIAHELSHASNQPSRFWAELLAVLLSYPHFSTAHRGHHASVATLDDTTTARRGESLYGFVFRCFAGDWRRAWRSEARRASSHPACSILRDARARWLLSVGSAITLSALLGGAWGIAVFAIQSATAIALFESINYVQHYGLERRRDATGRPEPIGPEHAWSSHHVVSNWYLFNLGLHADHHLSGGRAYHKLLPRHGSPKLPADYSAMVLLALVPSLFRRVMDARLAALDDALGRAPGPEKVAASSP